LYDKSNGLAFVSMMKKGYWQLKVGETGVICRWNRQDL